MAYSIEYYKKYEPIFGDWKIVREIGSGSFGKVFEIQREDFGKIQTAALKVITIPQDGDFERLLGEGHTEESAKTYIRDTVRGVVNEFEFMSDLSGNTNIVDYKDHKTYEHEDGNGWDIFIRMELLTPITAITKKREFTENEVIKLGKDMCRALELCRKKDIIHRDIKPENIFTNENGDFKLGDFGVARQAEKTQSGMTKTGTLTYMAPEVYRGEKYGPSVDIYSLGMVMYRLLNHNRAPFLPPFPQALTHTDMEVAFSKRINGEMLPMPSGECSHELCNIILKACAFRSEDRFASAEEMRKALESIGKAPAVNMQISEQQSQNNLSDNETVRVHRVQAEAPNREEIRATANIPQTSNVQRNQKKKSKVPTVLAIIGLTVFAILLGLYLIGISVEDQSEEYPKHESIVLESDKERNINLGQKCGENLYWELSDDGTLTIVGKGDMYDWSNDDTSPWAKLDVKNVKIDDSITSIGDYSFFECTNLTSITIPDSVTSIGRWAFFECTSLTSITIPDSVTDIEYATFYRCTSLTSITIPDSVTSIGPWAFDECTSLTSITIPDSVTSIGPWAFIECTSLTSITIPDSVTSIGDYSFFECTNLTSITIPDSVTSIGTWAFGECNNLTIRCPSGSYAERYAKVNKIPYKLIW